MVNRFSDCTDILHCAYDYCQLKIIAWIFDKKIVGFHDYMSIRLFRLDIRVLIMLLKSPYCDYFCSSLERDEIIDNLNDIYIHSYTSRNIKRLKLVLSSGVIYFDPDIKDLILRDDRKMLKFICNEYPNKFALYDDCELIQLIIQNGSVKALKLLILYNILNYISKQTIENLCAVSRYYNNTCRHKKVVKCFVNAYDYFDQSDIQHLLIGYQNDFECDIKYSSFGEQERIHCKMKYQRRIINNIHFRKNW